MIGQHDELFPCVTGIEDFYTKPLAGWIEDLSSTLMVGYGGNYDPFLGYENCPHSDKYPEVGVASEPGWDILIG